MSSSSGVSTSSDSPARRDPFVQQTTHANGNGPNLESMTPLPLDRFVLPSASKSLSGISLRAFLLGTFFGLSLPLIILALFYSSPLWRVPFFLSSLTLFHFLEYYTTARYNPTAATTSAFLLSSNGSAYNVAHTLAFLECFLHYYFYPSGLLLGDSLRIPVLVTGFAMLIVGQATRSVAMAQAGSNFNHLVQVKKKQGHELVTNGVYASLRHPSYFGFWWWGLGTQLVLGNGVCLIGYAVVLWRFFKGRIEKEEKYLVGFFGDEYVQYRERTTVGIPFIP